METDLQDARSNAWRGNGICDPREPESLAPAGGTRNVATVGSGNIFTKNKEGLSLHRRKSVAHSIKFLKDGVTISSGYCVDANTEPGV
jgi:hypothetical protein